LRTAHHPSPLWTLQNAPGFDKSIGMKWSIHSLRNYLLARHGPEPTNELFHGIQSLIMRCLLAVQPAMINDRHSFELYGYDVLIDQALKPWIIEVRALAERERERERELTYTEREFTGQVQQTVRSIVVVVACRSTRARRWARPKRLSCDSL
jgi:hypothetical protein